MNRLGLDFKNRIVNIVSSSKTVIAFMDDELKKRDFHRFFPNESLYHSAEHVTFDFENKLLRVKSRPSKHASAKKIDDPDANIKEIPMPAIDADRQALLDIIKWDDAG